jgi:type I restriction enzyme, S subunit
MPELAKRTAAWTKVSFGDVVRQVKDRIAPDQSGLERYVAGEHMDTDDLRVRRWGEIGNGYLGPAFHMRFKPGHVLYGSRRTYLRKVAVADFEGITANTTYVLEPNDPSVLLPELLPFIMQTEPFTRHSVRESKGSVNPYVNFSDLASYEFALPPIEEQRRIVQALQSVDSTQEALLTASVAAQEMVSSWVHSRLYEHSWPECEADKVLTRATVGIVVKPASLYVEEGAGVPALRSLNVRPHQIMLDDCVSISHEGHAAHRKSRLQPGDVVVVRSGRPGDAAVIPEGFDELNCIDLIIATPSEELRPHFLCAVLNSEFGRRQFASGTAGTAQKHFNVGVFKKLRLPVPSLATQDEFVGTMTEIRKASEETERRLKAIRLVRSRVLSHSLEP